MSNCCTDGDSRSTEYRNVESFRLENTFKLIESNC